MIQNSGLRTQHSELSTQDSGLRMELAFRVGSDKTIANWNVQISPALMQVDSEF